MKLRKLLFIKNGHFFQNYMWGWGSKIPLKPLHNFWINLFLDLGSKLQCSKCLLDTQNSPLMFKIWNQSRKILDYNTFGESFCQELVMTVVLRPSEILLEIRSARSKILAVKLACWKLCSVSTIGYGDQVQACSKLARLARKFWLAKLAGSLDSQFSLNTRIKQWNNLWFNTFLQSSQS